MNPIAWVRRRKIRKKRLEDLGSLAMAMHLGERAANSDGWVDPTPAARELASARFSRPMKAVLVTVPPRTIERCFGQPLTLRDIIAASFGVLGTCDVKFPPGETLKLGERMADIQDKEGDIVKIENVAAGLAGILDSQGLGIKREEMCVDGLVRSMNRIVISGVPSAILANWENGVHHYDVLSAITSDDPDDKESAKCHKSS